MDSDNLDREFVVVAQSKVTSNAAVRRFTALHALALCAFQFRFGLLAVAEVRVVRLHRLNTTRITAERDSQVLTSGCVRHQEINNKGNRFNQKLFCIMAYRNCPGVK